MSIFDFFTKTIGIDPGSENLRIVHDGKIVFNEKSQVLVNSDGNTVQIGNAAFLKKEHRIIKPIDIVIRDFQAFEYLIRGAMDKVEPSKWLKSSMIVYYSIPLCSANVDKRAYKDSGEHAGGKSIFLIHQAVLSAISLNILFVQKNFILIDIGASRIEFSIFYNSIPIADKTIRIGTLKLIQVLKNHLLRKYDLSANPEETRSILTDLTSSNSTSYIYLHGQKIELEAIKDVLSIYMIYIKDEVLELFEKLVDNPNIESIKNNGLYFTGGGSKWEWLVESISNSLKIDYTISNNPFTDISLGLIKVIENPKDFEEYIIK